MALHNLPPHPGIRVDQTGFTHEAPDERLKVSVDKIRLFTTRLVYSQPRYRLEHVLMPFAMFLGLLMALLPADFKDYMGLSAAVWQAIAIILAIVTALATIVLFFCWVWGKWRHPRKSADELVQELIDQIEQDQAKWAAMVAKVRETL